MVTLNMIHPYILFGISYTIIKYIKKIPDVSKKERQTDIPDETSKVNETKQKQKESKNTYPWAGDVNVKVLAYHVLSFMEEGGNTHVCVCMCILGGKIQRTANFH